MKKYNLSIIIVTFNSERHIVKCINSINENRIKDTAINIIVIDNFSGDSTPKILRKLQKETKTILTIQNNKNVGFAKAVNQGIRKSKPSDYYLLLNPDTVLKNDSLEKLIKCSVNNKAGICGGSTEDKDGNENGCYFRFPSLLIGIFDFTNFRKLVKSDKWHKYFYYLDSKKPKQNEFSVDVVTGGYMLINIGTIEKIGYLDEDFFMYLEDVDYCLRAKKAGIKICHTNNSKIFHIGGASSNNKDRVRHSSWLWSRKVFFAKHFSLLKNLLIQPIFLLDDIFIMTKLALKK